MKFFTYMKQDKMRLGVKTERGLVDIEQAFQENPASHIPLDIMEVIESGQPAVSALQRFIDNLKITGKESFVLDESKITWAPCVTRPGKMICVGLNYRKHADESNLPYPEVPLLFNKFPNTLTGHLCDIAVPEVTEKMDYEVELCIIIGKQTKNVSVKDALNSIFGYCCANDLSARDLQMRTSQWMLGKICDGFCPLGPYLVTADEVGDPQNLGLKTYINEELRQNSNTSDMIFTCAEIVSYISQHMTLVPGDIILTGTPEGVAMGLPPGKQAYLKPGDTARIEIEQLGSLINTFE